MTSPSIRITVSAKDPVGGFSTGNSRYRILDMSKLSARPALLSVRSVGTLTNVYSGGMSWSPVFFPAVTFLDSSRKTIVTITEDRPANPSLSCKALMHCGLAIVTVEVPMSAQYAVLHTPIQKVGQTRVEALPGRVADQTYNIGGTFVSIPGGGASALRTIGMSVGELEVQALAAK